MQQRTETPSPAVFSQAATGPVPLPLDVLNQVVGGGGPVGNWSVKLAAVGVASTSAATVSRAPVGNW